VDLQTAGAVLLPVLRGLYFERAMKHLNVIEFNKELEKLDGFSVWFSQFTRSHSRLVLELEHENEVHILHLFFLVELSGPTAWGNCRLRVSQATASNGDPYYEMVDEVANFRAFGCEEVNLDEMVNCRFL
jgi:hypothetical protein